MQRNSIIALAVLATALLSFKALDETKWTVDKSHAKLGFSAGHLLVSDVEGNFKSFNATITAGSDDFTNASVELSADASTISTDNDQRDGHIKSADFLDTAKFPKIEFKSTSFKPSKVKGTFIIKGNLTLHGITKEITLSASSKRGVNPMNNNKPVIGFKISGTIKRSDFGIGASIPAAVVSEEVGINANVEFGKE